MEAVLCYNISVFDRDRPADQDSGGLPLLLGDEVEAVVHPVDQVEIGRPRRGEEGLGPRGALIAIGVARLVDPADIRFRLADPAHQPPAVRQHPDDVPAQQVPGRRQGIAGVEVSCEDVVHGRSPFS